jgi:CO/xanthine dehydrogenase Mo-binding subunit
MTQALKVVGTRPIRPDGADKVTGRANYGADVYLPGMLFARIKRSPHPHARIVSIDASKARALAGVKAVVTGADFPVLVSAEEEAGEGTVNLAEVSGNCMAKDKALYEGHAVAAVAAISEEIAAAAIELIEVTYAPLPHVIEVEAAMAPGAPLLHESMITNKGEPGSAPASNIATRKVLARGDLTAGFASADVVVEGRYVVSATHQGYIEPHACVAVAGADDNHQVYASSQGHFMVRNMTARILGMKTTAIRVHPMEIGGGFGGKTVIYIEPVALKLSQLTGRPVKIVMSREEVFRATGPTSAAVCEVKLGAKKDGTLVASALVLKFQAGAYPGSPVGAATMTALAPYDVPNVEIVGYDVVSNRPKSAAYRAPGAPISAFAVESALDELAEKLGMDPIDLRLKNIAKAGTQAVYGPTYRDIAFAETLEAAKAHPHYKAPLGPNQGRGVAAGYWFNIGGESSAAVRIDEDGGVTVASGNPDIGGSRASMAMMAAETLGVPYDRVRVIVPDTSSIGFSMLTGGSRVTFATGMAVIEAANKVIEDLKRRAAQLWDVDLKTVWFENGEARAAKQKPLTIAAIAAHAGKTGGPIAAEATLNAQGAGPGFAVHICDIEIDKETGRSTVVRYTALQDVGRAVHPAYVEGQMQGGAAQGIGWALNEEYIWNKDGRLENPGFLDYRTPVASDLPMIDTVIVEDAPNARHPYGVKGVGEAPIIPPLAACANAISHAIGKRMRAVPLSPPVVLEAIEG